MPRSKKNISVGVDTGRVMSSRRHVKDISYMVTSPFGFCSSLPFYLSFAITFYSYILIIHTLDENLSRSRVPPLLSPEPATAPSSVPFLARRCRRTFAGNRKDTGAHRRPRWGRQTGSRHRGQILLCRSPMDVFACRAPSPPVNGRAWQLSWMPEALDGHRLKAE